MSFRIADIIPTWITQVTFPAKIDFVCTTLRKPAFNHPRGEGRLKFSFKGDYPIGRYVIRRHFQTFCAVSEFTLLISMEKLSHYF